MASFVRVFVLLTGIPLIIFPQEARGQQSPLKFDFGAGRSARGYLKVTSKTRFSKERRYGFLDTAGLKELVRDEKQRLSSDLITSNRPFFFSVMLPEGNYNVTLCLGDTEGTSSQTVRAENRRLLLENTNTPQGRIVKKEFTVNIRVPSIAGTVDQVRLKPREYSYLHWDNQLTIEFNGKEPKVCGLEITPADKKAVTVYLAGNSTVVDQPEEPYAAWGQMIPSFFRPGKVVVANYAESGETLKAFRAEKRLEKILSLMKPKDYLFIEFAHNDQKAGANHLDPFTSYKETLKYYIAEVRKKRGIPVLVISMHRRNFNEKREIVNTLGDYPDAMRELGKEANVPIIDLNGMSKVLYEAWGPEGSLKAFVHYPPNTFPGQTEKLEDNTHFTPYGAYELAKCVVEGIRKQVPSLGKCLRKDIPFFDPAKPDSPGQWYWPLSPGIDARKPDGN